MEILQDVIQGSKSSLQLSVIFKTFKAVLRLKCLRTAGLNYLAVMKLSWISVAKQNKCLFPWQAETTRQLSEDSCSPCADSAARFLQPVVLLSQHTASMTAAVEKADGTSAPNSSATCHFNSQLTQQNWSHGPTQLQVGWEMSGSLWISSEQQIALNTAIKRACA